MDKLKFSEFIERINSLKTDEEIKQFALHRINELEQTSTIQDISFINDGKIIGNNFHGYINADSPITTSLMVDPFYMNDLTLYIEFIKDMSNKTFNNPFQLFHAMQKFIESTFGFKGNQRIRESVYLQDRDQKISIKDFYKNDSALCSERSAAVQNLLSFCGIDSYLVFGKLLSGNETESHAYNILKMGNGTLILYDATNPVFLDLNGQVGKVPAYSKIGNDDIEHLSEIEFDFESLEKIYNAELHSGEVPRKYKTFVSKLNKDNSDVRMGK